MGDDARDKAQEYAQDRLSLSLVLQACGRGIRSKNDRCSFVLLDKRYDEYGWRRFLEPRPYNLCWVSKTVLDFWRSQRSLLVANWDQRLLDVLSNEMPTGS